MAGFPMRRFAPWLVAILVATGAWISYETLTVSRRASPFLYDNLAGVPTRRVGLFLGCSARLGNGSPNPYFQARVRATTDLFRNGKIEYVLISGDNGRISYNEPEMAKSALLEQGIPADRIVLDYAGFRTLDSIARAQAVFGLSDFTVISQRFHNERAVYLARSRGISAIGFNAEDQKGYYGVRVHLREMLAKARAVLDVRFGARPKFLGPKIRVG